MSFTCFPKLPLELRRQIFKEACCVSRVIDIRANPIGSEEVGIAFFGEYLAAPVGFRTFCKSTPSILHVSREARSIGLKYYGLEFGTEFHLDIGPGVVVDFKAAPKIYLHSD